MGLTPARPVWRKCWERLGCAGIWKAPGLQPPPPELSSPAIKITSASLVHWLLRKGCRSCWRACWKAGLIASTAEIGKTHLGEASSRQGTAKREGRQVAKGENVDSGCTHTAQDDSTRRSGRLGRFTRTATPPPDRASKPAGPAPGRWQLRPRAAPGTRASPSQTKSADGCQLCRNRLRTAVP